MLKTCCFTNLKNKNFEDNYLLQSVCMRIDLDLPHKMAHLDIMETTEPIIESATPAPSSRVLRTRKSVVPEPNNSVNRRVIMKPRKRNISENSSQCKQIEALYLNKKIKTLTRTLETIYEEPKTSTSDSDSFIVGRKVKRLLTFQRGQYTKEKIKKRRAKIKKLLGTKSFLNRKKIPMNVFLKTIECLELDEVVNHEIETIDNIVV